MSKRGLSPTPGCSGLQTYKKHKSEEELESKMLECDDDDAMETIELQEIYPAAGSSVSTYITSSVSPVLTGIRAPCVSPVQADDFGCGPFRVSFKSPCVTPEPSPMHTGAYPGLSDISYKSRSPYPYERSTGVHHLPTDPGMHSGPYSISPGSSRVKPRMLFEHNQPRTHRSRAEDRCIVPTTRVTDLSQLSEYAGVVFGQTEETQGSSGSEESMDVDEPLGLKRAESSSSVEREQKSYRLDWTGSRM